MKRKEILYNAISGISEGKVADAYEYSNKKEKNTTLMRVLKIAGVAALFCSFIVLSLVLLKVSGPKTPVDGTNAASSGEMTEKEDVYIAEVTADESGSISKGGQIDDNSPVIFNQNAVEMINKVYSHPGTSEMRFKLNQTVTEDEYKDFPVINTNSRITRFYDPCYDVKPVYYDWEHDWEHRLYTDDEVAEIRKNEQEQGLKGRQCILPDWYSGTPYVRYDVNGYGKEKRIVHLDILDENISVCGLTVNSSLDEAEKVLKDLGFEVTRRKMDFTYGSRSDREYILAQADGFWIEFETVSEYKGAAKSAYPYIDLVYKNSVVPAVIRMGMEFTYVTSDTHHAISQEYEQFDLL